MLRGLFAIGALGAALAVAVSCSSSGSISTTDATTVSGGSGGSGSDDAEAGDGAVSCAGVSCPPVAEELASASVRACCTDLNRCGLETPIVHDCHEANEPGVLDASCPSVTVAGVGFTFAGCCRTDGRCGALDTLTSLGCVPLEDLGHEARNCIYDSAGCTELSELPCDGPEDCLAGRVCCGRLAGTLFDAFRCMDRCSVADPTSGALWLEICHTGGTCQEPDQTCSASAALPDFLMRCVVPPGGGMWEASEEAGTDDSSIDVSLASALDAADTSLAPDAADEDASTSLGGQIQCGTVICKDGNKCCLRAPAEPYCTPFTLPCECEPSEATSDAESDAASDAPSDAAGGGS